MTPAITVLMPAYNAAAFLHEGIESVLAQTWRNFELLIVEDGSKDETLAIARGVNDPRVRVLTNGRNLGLAATLNHGLREARGTFIARQDADDLSHPERLARQLARMEAEPSLFLLGSQAHLADLAGRSHGRIRLPCSTVALRWASLFDNPFAHSTVFYRRAALLEEFGGYDETWRICEDWPLWSAVLRSHRAENLPDTLATIRVHTASMCNAGSGALQEACARIQAANFSAEFAGEKWTEAELALLGRLRTAVPPGDVPEFHRLFARAREAFIAKEPEAAWSRDFHSTIARQFIRLGYNLLPHARGAAWREMLRALRVDGSAASSIPWLRALALTALGGRARHIYQSATK